MRSSNSQVTEWDFSGTRGLAKSRSRSSLSDYRKSDDEMSLSSGSSVSDDSGGSVLEREETRHQQHVKFIERMDTAKSSCGNGPEKSTEKLITNTIPCVDGLPVLEWNFYRIVLMYIVVTSLVGVSTADLKIR
jgi:hypothetical protein